MIRFRMGLGTEFKAITAPLSSNVQSDVHLDVSEPPRRAGSRHATFLREYRWGSKRLVADLFGTVDRAHSF